MSKPLEVTITVGTSFSIGGAFSDPELYSPVGERMIDCGGHGLCFMLDCFDRYNIKASFFIETAQHCYFGDEAMGKIVSKLSDAGQDVQLLIHPCWFHYDQNGDFSQEDSCVGRPYGDVKAIFEKSISAFERIAGKKPDVIRCGNMQIDHQIYRIMAELGITMSSSVGLGIYTPEGKDLLLCNGRTRVGNVMEMPLFTYRDKDVMGGYAAKTLQIASCSWREMRYILKKARRDGIENIVLLTQPFDYIKKKDIQYNEITQNRVNQERLERLCEFISDHNDDFIAKDFGAGVSEWQNSEKKNNIKFKIPTRYRNARKIENFINDTFWNY